MPEESDPMTLEGSRVASYVSQIVAGWVRMCLMHAAYSWM
jgi:hypothetical protein